MEIISHRGFWEQPNEKNTLKSFEKSFSENFGTETDFRDFKGKLVISHDIADENCMEATRFFEIYNSYNCKATLALNIKSDGLQKELEILLKKYEIENYFVFDMSIPDTLGYLKNQIVFFSRQSEYELSPSLYEKCSGIWLDSFEKQWFDIDLIQNHFKNNKKVALVSPELHKREFKAFWDYLKISKLFENKNLILCTDLPNHAKQFFK